MFPQLDFEHLFISMVSAGRSLLLFFANFGETFTQPFYESFVRVNAPSLYILLRPLFTTWKEFLNLVFPEAVTYFVNFSMFDLIGFGVTVMLIVKVWKALWDALPGV